MRRTLSLLMTLAVLTSCTEQPAFVSPTGALDDPSLPAFDMLDGARGGGAAGFYWLPPMVASLPTASGTFDNSVLNELEVELCEVAASACVPSGLNRQFSSTTGSFFDRIKLFPNQQYQVMYSSAADNLDATKDYRATVRAYGVVLGFADIDVVTSLAELQAVDRTRFASLYRGQSLSISFRLESVFPTSCSVASIDALADQVFGAGIANDTFRASIRRLAYLHRFGGSSETENALQGLADELSLLADAAATSPALLALIEQLRAALYCVVDRTVPVPPVEGTVTGIVTGTNGRGLLNGVTVRVDPSGLNDATDATGRYSIVNVPAGAVSVSLTGGLPTGCTLPAAQNAIAADGSVTVDFEVQCAPGDVSIVPSTLVAGVAHACALTTAGAAYCWGNVAIAMGAGSVNGSNVPVPVSGGLTFVSLSAGDLHTCGVTATGAAYCWGSNAFGQLGDDTNNQRTMPVMVSGGLSFAALAAGNIHTCGITRAGAAYCWGSNWQGRLGDGTFTHRRTPVAVVGGHTFKSIAVSRRNTSGQGHSCGVTTAGDVYCWGNNTSRQLGAVTPQESPVPLKVDVPVSVTSVVAGVLHTCALGTDAKAYCWGFRASYGTPGGTIAPSEVGGGRTFASLAAGVYHTCALTENGNAYCFGTNSSGELGDGTSRSDGAVGNPPLAVSGERTYATLAAGGGFTCGVTDAGAAYCWGTNGGGELGDGSNGRRLTPVPVLGGHVFSTLSVGGAQNCAATTNGTAYCWGENQSSRLGDGTTLRRHAPWPVSGGLSFSAIFTSPAPVSESSRAHSCGLTFSGTAYCWGSNSNQQLGIPGGTRSVPTSLQSVPTLSQFALGGFHSCGLTPEGLTYCWGSNSFREMGRGAISSGALSPDTIVGGLRFAKLAAGSHHTCGLTDAGAAFCWGRNNRGQLGDGTSGTDRSVPVPVSGGLSFVSLAAGFEHTCAVAVGGGAYCWGYGNFGQLGNGLTGPSITSQTPVPVGGSNSFVFVAAGHSHTCGLTSSGSAFCWGWNQSGQLGDGTITSRTTPIQVEGGLLFTQLGAGRDHTCGLTSSGAAYCWGWTVSGRVGDEYIRQVAGGLIFKRP